MATKHLGGTAGTLALPAAHNGGWGLGESSGRPLPSPFTRGESVVGRLRAPKSRLGTATGSAAGAQRVLGRAGGG